MNDIIFNSWENLTKHRYYEAMSPKAKKLSKRKALIKRIERGLVDCLSDPAPAVPTINIITRAMAGLPGDYPDWSEQDLQFL